MSQTPTSETPTKTKKRKKRGPRPKPLGVFDADETVAHAVERVMLDRFSTYGASCPCCKRLAKVYRRTLHLSVLRLLVRMYRMQHQPLPGDPKPPWVKIGKGDSKDKNSMQSAGGDYAKLRWWGLIEPMPDGVRDDGSSRVGWWRVTELGRNFVRGRASVRRYLYEYDAQPMADPPDADTSMARIADFSVEFDYQSILATS